MGADDRNDATTPSSPAASRTAEEASLSSTHSFHQRVHSVSGASRAPDHDYVVPSAALVTILDDDEVLDGVEVTTNGMGGVEGVAQELSRYWLLAVQLSTYVGIGWKWLVQFIRLVIFSMLLLPGFLQMIWFYFFSPRCIRSVRYGRKPRQVLDLYVPRAKWFKESPARPVAVFVTGGAWIIGHRAWGALLARRLSQRGILVCSVDYRNFPQGTAEDMVEDFNKAMRWICTHIRKFGGDPDNITVVGQSAGAHLSAMGVLHQALAKSHDEASRLARSSWSAAAAAQGQVDANDVASRVQSKVLSIDTGRAERELRAGVDREAGLQPTVSATPGTPLLDGAPSVISPIPSTPKMPLQDCDNPHAEIRRALFSREGSRTGGPDGAAPTKGSKRDRMPFASYPRWPIEKVRAFIGVSGVYDIVKAAPHFNERGMYESLTKGIFSRKGEMDLEAYSPARLLRSEAYAGAAAFHPRVWLLHGDRDKTAPLDQSEEYYRALLKAGVRGALEVMVGHTHTSPLLEAPMSGQDRLVEEVARAIIGEDVRDLHWIYRVPMCPSFLTQIASAVCPF